MDHKLTYTKNFSEINSPIKRIQYKKYIDYNNKGYVKILFENNDMAKIVPNEDCCSISYIVELNNYPFSDLIGTKIITIKEIKNFKLSKLLFKKIKPINFKSHDNNYNRYHVYKVIFSNNDNEFYFGLINASNGYYDGWISIFKKHHK